MNQFDSSKDYYALLGADEATAQPDIERLYKRLAVQFHPDRGGDEEAMKSLNEAYGVLGDVATRHAYDAERKGPLPPELAPPYASPPAQITLFTGQWVGAILFLASGLTLALLVRFQWIWFLWPLAILAVFLIIFGLALAHAAVHRFVEDQDLARRWIGVTLRALFWIVILIGGYGIYLVLR